MDFLVLDDILTKYDPICDELTPLTLPLTRVHHFNMIHLNITRSNKNVDE